MAITTSVVICAYTEKRWNQLVAAVESVRAQDEPVGDLVLVIDHHDRLLCMAQERWPMPTMVANQGPQGLSGSRNAGIEVSSADIVLFLDDDATAESDGAGRLTAPYADPTILGVGGSAQPLLQQPPPRWWWSREFGWVVGCRYRGQPTSMSRARNPMGCNMSVRRSVLHAVPAERASWPNVRARCLAEGISKAGPARNVGPTPAQYAEIAYVRRVLPIGVLHNLARGLHGDLAALVRAGAIVAGLPFTATGFLKIRVLVALLAAGENRLRSPAATPTPVPPR